MNYQARSRAEIARRVAQDIREGMYVNLGIGLPTKIADYLPFGRKRDSFFHFCQRVKIRIG